MKDHHNMNPLLAATPAASPKRKSFFRKFQNKRVYSGMFILAFVVIGVALLTGSQAASSLNSVKSGNWNDPTVWGGKVPGATDMPVISAGHTVTYNVATTRVEGMRVSAGGTLRFDPNLSTTLESTENVLVEGKLEMKPANASIKQTLRFVGIDESEFVGGGMMPLATDVGMWVMGAGTLDIVGAQKTGWLHASGSIAAGSTSVQLEKAPVGWAQGDEIVVSPTGAPNTSGFYDGFDTGNISSISGSTVNLDGGMARPHPKVNGKWTAEVMNLTRNVSIEGTESGRTHVMVHSSQPQVIKYASVRYFGPRQNAVNGYTDPVLGRYGIHFHHNEDGSRGSLIEGTVVRDGGSHSYVPHESHGVTFRDTISYNTYEDAYWWDLGPDTRTPGAETHDTLYDHALAALVKFDPGFRGYRLAGFQLVQGNRNEIRDSVAVGVQGNSDASGFSWAESFGPTSDSGKEGHGEWNFARDNISHNNRVNGLFAWQNDYQPHVIANFDAYHNGEFGIEHGAYLNNYLYEKMNLFGNGMGGVKNIAGTTFNENQQTFRDVVVDGAGMSDHLIDVSHHTLESAGPIHYENLVLTNAKKQPIYVHRESNTQAHVAVEFLNSTYNGTPLASIAHNTLFRWDGSMVDSIFARVMNGSNAYRVQNPATNEIGTRTNIAPFANTVGDVWTPQPSLNYPTGGSTVNDTVIVDGQVYDNSAITRVEFLIDEVVRATDTTAPYNYAWDTAGLSGKHTVQIKATDSHGNVGYSPITTVYVGNGPTTPPPAPEPEEPEPEPPVADTTAPNISLASPANGTTISGNASVSATASDNIGVTKVEFFVDGTLRNTDNTAPYAFTLDTTSLSNGSHTLTARATDAAGNTRTTAAITVSVQNSAPDPTPTYIDEDVNRDGKVNIVDISMVISKYRQTANLGRADVNGDGIVNLLDISRLISKYTR